MARERSAVSSRYSDSGVVTRMCGGVRSIAARSFCGVSPLRTAAVIWIAGKPIFFGDARGFPAGLRQVLVDIRGKRLQRRDVDDPHFVGQAALQPLAKELVDRGQEGGERLPGARRRGDERVVAAPDGTPALELGVGGRAEAARPPCSDYGVKILG